jgi:pimeloyl-ACP methyl ester carboxylesterase
VVDEAAQRDAVIPEIDWRVLPPGIASSTVRAPSGDIAVISTGDPADPHVLLAPGVTGSKEDFLLVMPMIAAAGYFVQAVDLAGQYESGGAGPAPGGRFDYDLFVDDMVALIDHGGAPVHLLGYSFAGTVAALVTVRRPDLVRTLTLMATPPDAGNGFAHMKRIAPLSHVVNGRVGAALMIWGVKNNLNKVGPQRLAFVRERFELTSRRSVDDIIGLMLHAPDVEAELRALPLPKLVAVGIHDLWPWERSAALADRIGARYVGYDTGHSPSETAPHQLTRDLLALYAMA